MQRRGCARGQDQRGEEAGRRENGLARGHHPAEPSASWGPRGDRFRASQAGPPGGGVGPRDQDAPPGLGGGAHGVEDRWGGGGAAWGEAHVTHGGGGALEPAGLGRRRLGAPAEGRPGARASQVLGVQTPRAAVHFPGGGAKTWLAPPGLETRGSVTKLIAPAGQLCTWPPRPDGSGGRVRASRRLQRSYRNVIKKHGRAAVWMKRLISSPSKKGMDTFIGASLRVISQETDSLSEGSGDCWGEVRGQVSTRICDFDGGVHAPKLTVW